MGQVSTSLCKQFKLILSTSFIGEYIRLLALPNKLFTKGRDERDLEITLFCEIKEGRVFLVSLFIFSVHMSSSSTDSLNIDTFCCKYSSQTTTLFDNSLATILRLCSTDLNVMELSPLITEFCFNMLDFTSLVSLKGNFMLLKTDFISNEGDMESLTRQLL